MIVLDEDRKKAIHINQSIFCCLLGVFAIGAEATIATLATAGDIARVGGRASFLHIVGSIGASPIASLFLAVVMLAPAAWILHRWCFWRVYVSDGVLTYRSLYRSRSVRTADIKRVMGLRGREMVYKIFLEDGTSITMHDVGFGSLGDLARLEDEIICEIPQVEMSRRLFGKIMKRGYIEYI